MDLLNKVARYTSYVLNRPVIRQLVPNSWYIKTRYYFYIGKKLNLKDPKTFNEKLQWLKLYYYDSELKKLVDKYEVRKIIEKKIGNEYLIPLLGGPWEKFEDIDFSDLPDSFVLKTTHDSGGVVICRDKETFEMSKAKEKINEHLKRKFFWLGREWTYKNIQPRIIAEKFMLDETGVELKDYKIFCFNGVPKVIQVDIGRFSDHRRNFYSTEWDYLGFTTNIHKNDPNIHIKKPEKLNKMLDIAMELSKDIPHVRVDLYYTADKIYFGEMTFFHGSGFEKFNPDKWDLILGEALELPKTMK